MTLTKNIYNYTSEMSILLLAVSFKREKIIFHEENLKLEQIIYLNNFILF